jgi:hypothetical protein
MLPNAAGREFNGSGVGIRKRPISTAGAIGDNKCSVYKCEWAEHSTMTMASHDMIL